MKTYARCFGLRTFVETGTFLGDTVEAMRETFARVYSVELSQALYQRARRRFAAYPHIDIRQGDSAKMLPAILAEIREPALFWLDGHFSAGITALGDEVTPILVELEHVFRHQVQDHVLLIDDARLFTGDGGYPQLDAVRSLVAAHHPGWVFDIRHDIIRCHA